MSNDEDLLNLSKRIIEKIERSMAISTATKMIKSGKYSDEEIIDLSDLSLEKVEQLRKVLTGN